MQGLNRRDVLIYCLKWSCRHYDSSVAENTREEDDLNGREISCGREEIGVRGMWSIATIEKRWERERERGRVSLCFEGVVPNGNQYYVTCLLA